MYVRMCVYVYTYVCAVYPCLITMINIMSEQSMMSITHPTY